MHYNLYRYYQCGISSDYLAATVMDRASVNSVTMKIIKIIYPNAVDVGCFSHAFIRVGEHFNMYTDSDRVYIGN